MKNMNSERMCVMKKTAKRVLAAVCALVLVVGSGMSIFASDTDAGAGQSGWVMYSGNKESIITDEGHLVVSVDNAGVNIPENLKKGDLGLSVTLTIPNEDALNSMKTGVMEIAQDICDVAELSWELSEQNLKIGKNVIEVELTDGAATGGNVTFDVNQTINWFRIYSITNPNGNAITLEEVKLVDIREAGLEFGAKKTADTYLQLTDPLEGNPQSIEASVKMESETVGQKEWTLHSGTRFSGVSMPVGSYTTTADDEPGEGMTCFTLDASNAAITGFEALQHSLAIDASEYATEQLAISFWVYSSTAGTLATGYDNGQIRLSSNADNMGENCLFYYMYEISVNEGWNYIEIPLSSMKTDIIGDFSISNINTWGIAAGYQVPEGRKVYFGDIRLVVVSEDSDAGVGDEEDTPETKFTGWTLHSGASFSGVSMPVGSYTTMADDDPGAGMECFTLDASSAAITGFEALQTNLGIDASAYDMSDLTFAFWVYSNKDTTLGADWAPHIRISSNVDNVGSNCLFYYMYEIQVNAGWNYIEIPLSSMKTDIIGDFSVGNINTWGITSYAVPQGTQFYFGDMMLLPPEEVVDTGEWTLHSGASFSGVSMSVGSYTTTASDEPGEGMTCFTLDASSAAITGFEALQHSLAIDASKYSMDKLSIEFWVYSNTAGTLATGYDNGQIRLSSNADNMGGNCLFYYMHEIQVDAGWNYIKIPLSSMKTDIIGNFSISNINTWGIAAGYQVPQGTIRYFGDFKLVAEQPEPITSVVLRAGSDTDTTTGHTVTTGTTVAGDKLGADKTYNILSDGSSALSGFGTMKTGLGIDASASEMSELAVAFWVYSNEAGTLGTGDQFRIGSGPYLGSNALIYYFSDIQVEAGWNYVELPLDTWKEDIKQDFTLKNIDVFGYSNYSLAEGQVRYIADIQLINKKLVSVEMPEVYVDVTKDVTTVENNYMIFSNTNAGDINPYALFITEEGYPSLLYGTTQFTLTQDVRTGEWVDIAAVRDDSGFVSFYIDGEIAARSDVPVTEIGAPATAHCIGADGAGAQIMDGYIADVRVWSDIRNAEEIQNNLVEKEAGVLDNGLNAEAEGLMGSWFLLGDIQDVLEILPDNSANANDLVYRGSRADDWIDYEIPEEIGEDYWSLVFIPDIQKLTFQSIYSETWYAMAEWIAANIETENIQHVIGAGDTTDGNTIDHYQRAMEGFEKFNDLVPTSVIIGNHDYVWGVPNRDSAVYQSYFGEDGILTTAASNTYVGYFEDPAGLSTTENSYYRFSVNGTKWMILQLEYHPRVSALEWAQGILESHPDDNVIFVTHSYLDPNGNYADNTNMTYISGDDAVGGSIGGTTEAIWSEYLSDYTNIKMILCGHSHNGTGAVMTKTEMNAEGGEVPVLMINAQDMDYDAGVNDKTAYYDYKPVGMLGILRFSADGTNVALQYYAPTSEKSFSPEDPFGNEDSNNLKYTLSVEACSHVNTTVKVNEDEATGSTNGYTGDTYCTDCETMIERGTIIAATGEQPKTETDETENEEGAEVPVTGDTSNALIWFAVLICSVIVTYFAGTKYRKEEV